MRQSIIHRLPGPNSNEQSRHRVACRGARSRRGRGWLLVRPTKKYRGGYAGTAQNQRSSRSRCRGGSEQGGKVSAAPGDYGSGEPSLRRIGHPSPGGRRTHQQHSFSRGGARRQRCSAGEARPIGYGSRRAPGARQSDVGQAEISTGDRSPETGIHFRPGQGRGREQSHRFRGSAGAGRGQTRQAHDLRAIFRDYRITFGERRRLRQGRRRHGQPRSDRSPQGRLPCAGSLFDSASRGTDAARHARCHARQDLRGQTAGDQPADRRGGTLGGDSCAGQESGFGASPGNVCPRATFHTRSAGGACRSGAGDRAAGRRMVRLSRC